MGIPVTIHMAREDDVPALLAIYAPYVTDTAITFEYEAPDAAEFTRRMRRILARYPYLAAESEKGVLGYAYAAPFKERAAYDWAVETTIYLRRDCRGMGVGRRLYQQLEELLKRQHITNANACIAYPNPGSILFHERMGYREVGHFTRCGYKLGRWYDMIWMEKLLSDHPADPKPVVPARELAFEPVRFEAHPTSLPFPGGA